MSLEVTQEFITRKYVAQAKAERNERAMTNKARLRRLPGYLPVARRPGCRHCGKKLPIYVYSQQTAKYGYQGRGVFCTLACGYWYGMKVAGA